MKKPEWGIPSPEIDVTGSFTLPTVKPTAGRIPRKLNIHYDIPMQYDLKRLFEPPTPEQLAAERELQEAFFKGLEEQIAAENKKTEAIVEHICRNYVTPPIKGEITKGKVRWRGLSLAYGRNIDGCYSFIGIIQRGVMILPDGTKQKL